MINVRMQTPTNRLKPKITVIGVGGAGGNAVNNMIHSGLEGCDFLVCNTDAQALEGSQAPHKIQLGPNVTRGLGAGANPELGRAAAEESIEEIIAHLEGANMVFVTAGMGGGTGTGAAAVIAQAAREAGILTIGVITKPFHFEGTHRMKLAEAGITDLQKQVDTLIIIPNQNLFRIANEKTTFADAFRMADEVLQSGVRGVTDLMVMPGLINLDFADVRAVMAEMGKAMMGTGEAEGERRSVEAAEKAISNPLLDDVSMKGARGVLVNIMGGLDMTLFEVDEAMNRVREEVDPDANIIFGSTFDQTLQGVMRVSVVATGIEVGEGVQARPLHLANGSVEPARHSGQPQASRPITTPAPRPTAPSYAAYAPYERPAPIQREAAVTGAGGIPSSIIPSMQGQQQQGGQPTASAGVTAPTAPQAPQMGQAQPAQGGQTWQATATARKFEEADVTTSAAESWTKPQTQNYPARTLPPVSAPARAPHETQPRATRQGDVFIPPKPIDPRASSTAAPDLFGGEVETTTAAKPVKTEAKKSPSLFERFTLGRKDEAPVAAPAKTTLSGGLTVEEGGKQEDDELDIPAFLRRQAN